MAGEQVDGRKVAVRVVLAVLGFLLLGYFVFAVVPLIRGVSKMGLLEEQTMRDYSASNEENLKAIRSAILLYHDSEGGFPASEGWMDSIEVYLKTADLTDEDAAKKLKNPAYWDEAEKFGYAYNADLAGMYWVPDGPVPGDPECVQNPAETVLIFDSADLSRNAAGEPEALAEEGGLAVMVDGSVQPLASVLGQ